MLCSVVILADLTYILFFSVVILVYIASLMLRSVVIAADTTMILFCSVNSC